MQTIERPVEKPTPPAPKNDMAQDHSKKPIEPAAKPFVFDDWASI